MINKVCNKGRGKGSSLCLALQAQNSMEFRSIIKLNSGPLQIGKKQKLHLRYHNASIDVEIVLRSCLSLPLLFIGQSLEKQLQMHTGKIHTWETNAGYSLVSGFETLTHISYNQL